MTPEELFDKNINLAYSIYRRKYPIYDEDNEQLALIGFWKACQAYDSSKGTLSALATKYICTEIHNAYRGKRIEALSLDRPMESEEPFMEIVSGSDGVDSAIELRSMIERLTPRQREICEMLEVGMKPVEIARALRVSPEAVHQIIRRIRTKLKKGMNDGNLRDVR